MSRATYLLKLPNSLKKAAQRLANATGDRLLKFLRNAPSAPPEPEDRI